MTQEVKVSDTTNETTEQHIQTMTVDEGEQKPQEGESSQREVEEKVEEKALSAEELQAELERTRKEAASRRVAQRELEKKLEAMKTPEDFENFREELKEQNARVERELIAENVALKHGLPEDLAKRLSGNTREELEADAEALSKLLGGGGFGGSPSGGLRPSGDDTAFDPVEQAKKFSRANRQ